MLAALSSLTLQFVLFLYIEVIFVSGGLTSISHIYIFSHLYSFALNSFDHLGLRISFFYLFVIVLYVFCYLTLELELQVIL
jgi:hypothetical protein